MKTILLFIATLMLFISNAVAGNEASVQNVISSQMRLPSELTKHKLNELVELSFRVDENGKASILEIGTNNPELREYVTRKFNAMDFSKVSLNKQTTYFININFRVL
jgi:hypothetical protein